MKYRYEQRYVNDRLDTLITDDQIKSYYESHKEDFVLLRPLLKVRFVHIMKDSPDKDFILDVMSSEGMDAAQRADTLSKKVTLRYFDKSQEWMDASDLAKEFGLDHKSMLAALKDNTIKVEPQGRSDLMYAHVCDILHSGYAPIEYCESVIREIILSNRKYDLLLTLEQDLLESAQNNLEIENQQ